jgi:cell division protein FtsI/penicillin-binding protein 2
MNNLGLGNLDIGIIIIALLVLIISLIVLTIVTLSRFSRLNNKYQKFMQGNTARSLEADIIRLYEETKYVKLAVEKNRKDITALFQKASKSFSKAGLVKYDAFHQMGGKLSFSLALLDEKDNGFVLNSVHSVEGCYTYTKEIRGGVSSILLGDEEKQALDLAKEGNASII